MCSKFFLFLCFSLWMYVCVWWWWLVVVDAYMCVCVNGCSNFIYSPRTEKKNYEQKKLSMRIQQLLPRNSSISASLRCDALLLNRNICIFVCMSWKWKCKLRQICWNLCDCIKFSLRLPRPWLGPLRAFGRAENKKKWTKENRRTHFLPDAGKQTAGNFKNSIHSHTKWMNTMYNAFSTRPRRFNNCYFYIERSE